MQAASDAGEPVTRPALEAALAALKTELMDRTAALLWRLFGGMVALAGVIIAAVKLIP